MVSLRPPSGLPAPRPGSGGDSIPAPAAVTPPPEEPPPPAGPEPLVPLTAEAISTLNDRLDLLVRLGAARDAGVLSEDEFTREKERLLLA